MTGDTGDLRHDWEGGEDLATYPSHTTTTSTHSTHEGDRKKGFERREEEVRKKNQE